MRKNLLLKTTSLLFLSAAALPFGAAAQDTQVPLSDLSAFKKPSANWSVAGSVKSDFNKNEFLEKKDGQGILVTIPGKGKNEDIFTNFEHGDIDFSADFLMPKGSNSGIYLQGRYEIQLSDAWGKSNLTYQDLGAVYPRWDESRPQGQFAYEGVVPRINVSRAPGLWQNIRIVFQAPKFDAAGKKTANARIVKIVLNGVNIIENAELQGPTRGSAFPNEAATGPIRMQGDHGAVAFKNIKYNTKVDTRETDGSRRSFSEKQVFVAVTDEPVLLRSFVDINDKKRVTHAINVGYPGNISYSYDLGTGALFQVWKGGFVDGTPMWLFRGDGNTTVIGSKLPLTDAPSIAALASETAAWPDSLTASQAFRSRGYELDDEGYPTFKYEVSQLKVDDKLTSDGGSSLTRVVTVNGPVKDKLYLRAATGSDIVDAGNGMYAVNNYEYYVQFDKGTKPVLRTAGNGKELLIPIKDADKGASVKYSLIW
ncbi:DUF1080 domain-containing protein [Mucilaginibacter sp. JRF]|uniref:3-keto-disaccharide hydrolase n=1 Tax=Mucilaginibacter sp. JRF TaxID=2780088 RepID=UPI00187FE282|nr:DUF1080 domain-containing protein [Mucilaginibacter sp. JRF]MBE9582929.1 DUF1080 domain-containing protein [Mucilaginibacter sp. JRF]